MLDVLHDDLKLPEVRRVMQELHAVFEEDIAMLADKRKLYRIGVSCSSETGTVDDWKVE